MKTTNAVVCLTAGPSHVRYTLVAAASQDFSHNFSDVTLVFSDGSMVYYRSLLYLISPWWKELLIQVQDNALFLFLCLQFDLPILFPLPLILLQLLSCTFSLFTFSA